MPSCSRGSTIRCSAPEQSTSAMSAVRCCLSPCRRPAGRDRNSQKSILIAELTASGKSYKIDPGKVLGICTTGGGPTGHVCHPQRSSATLGLRHERSSTPRGNDSLVVLDGSKGTLRQNPSEEQLATVAVYGRTGPPGANAKKPTPASVSPATVIVSGGGRQCGQRPGNP